MSASPIRVALIDDSAVVRGALRQIIDAAPDMQVVVTAANGRLGLEELARVQADVILLDIEMPELDGLSALPKIIAAHPRSRVIMASSLTEKGAKVTMDALALGAVDYITKPTARAGPASLASLAESIVGKIRAIGEAGRRHRSVDIRKSAKPVVPPPMLPPLRPRTARPRVISIASSTGGPNALATVLRALPADCVAPIIVTQHMPPLFTELLAQRLQRESGRVCAEAVEGQALVDRHVYVAPGDYHLNVGLRNAIPYLYLSQSPPENHCRPAADVMFRSVAWAYGNACLAVVLTGMGEDGRRGCEAIRRAGGHVVVQDEMSSVVWGMPGAVANAGLAEHIVPLGDIGRTIGDICRGQS